MRVMLALRVAPPLALAAVVGIASLQALDLPDLSGKWRLNRDASDSPDQAVRGSGTNGRSGGGGGFRGRGGMGHGGGGRHGSAPPSDGGSSSSASSASSDDGGSVRAAFASRQTLAIRHQEPLFSITDASGRERVVYTDGRKVDEERSAGTTKVRARWKDGRIEVTSTPDKGPKVTETFAMTADRSQLMVTTTFERSRGGDVTIRSVYDAVHDEAPATAPPNPAPAAAPEPDADFEAV